MVDCLLHVGKESVPQVKEFTDFRVFFVSVGAMEREVVCGKLLPPRPDTAQEEEYGWMGVSHDLTHICCFSQDHGHSKLLTLMCHKANNKCTAQLTHTQVIWCRWANITPPHVESTWPQWPSEQVQIKKTLQYGTSGCVWWTYKQQSSTHAV